MPTTLAQIETKARRQLEEVSPRHWSSDELQDIITDGIKDLWRKIVDLKGEHYLVVNTTDVTLPADSDTLLGVPRDVHKIYLIEPADTQVDGTATGRHLVFRPIDYNHQYFISARSSDAIDPNGDNTIWYAITGIGGPQQAPKVYVAPQLTAAVSLRFSYVPTLPTLDSTSIVPVPGEADSALKAWTVAYARAKEREDRTPDPGWLAIYGQQRDELLNSLGLRQYQEEQVANAFFEQYW
jgi:hypothetical protein